MWQPPEYRAAFLPDDGEVSAVAASIGNDGTIGGRICEDTYASYPCHPVYWRAGALHKLGGIGQVNDVCTCDGHTLVGRVLVNGADHGAIWEDDVLIDVGVPAGHPRVNLVAVAHGNIVGTAYNGVAEGDGAYQTQQRAYRWFPVGGWVSMGFTEFGVYDVNSQGSAVGGFAVLWPNGSNAPIGIAGEGQPYRINDEGVIGGICVPDPYGPVRTAHPCEWTATTGWFAVSSDTTGSFEGINNRNEAVGWFEEDGRAFAVLWKP